MSRTLYGKNGTTLDVNVSGRLFLEKLTFCFWDKIGMPEPMSKKDTLLIARLLKNYLHLQKILGMKGSLGFGILSVYGFKEDEQCELDWTQEALEFFQNSGGLISESDYLKQFNGDVDGL